jgi:hypothetical protein|tara:strand:+ start:689 stop:970 length:282 start_codon:yes stop_codon:yes gene_type:complete
MNIVNQVESMIENPVEFVQMQLNSIIDQTHPLFTAITDEELVEDNQDHGVFERSFLHETGKRFAMRWRVYYGSATGTPEAARVVFEPAVTLAS